MKKIVFSLVIGCFSVFLPWSVTAAEQIVLPAGTEFFTAPDAMSAPAGKLSVPVRVDVADGRIIFSAQHPLAWYNHFYPLTIDGKKFFAAPSSPPGNFQAGILSVAIIMLLSWSVWLWKKRYPAGSAMDDLGKIGLAVILRWVLLAAVVFWWGNVIPAASDDSGYFQSAADILRGSWKGPWNYTIGLGIFYMPFILILRAVSFYDIAIAFDWFSAMVVAPAAMVLGYLLLRKLKLTSRQAFAALMIWAVWPFVGYHLEGWQRLIFPGFWSIPPLSTDADYFVWKYYAICINSGFNAMSDTPGMMVLFAAMLYAFKCPLRPLQMMSAGALWGAACLIRINYILFLPFFVWLCCQRIIRECSREPEAKNLAAKGRGVLKCGVWAASGFLLIFGIQLFVNWYQFGSPLTFGYILHYLDFAPAERPAAGFTLHTLLKWRNLRYLAMANHFWWTPGLAGLLFMKDPFRRNALVWWTLPLIIFFLGYSHTYCDARRFILPVFIAFFGAFAGLEVWQESDVTGRRNRIYAVFAVLAFSWIFTVPFFHGYGFLPAKVARYTPAGGQWFFIVSAAAALGLSGWLWQKKEHRLTGVLLFSLLYFWFAVWQVTGIILLFILGRAVYDLLPARKTQAVSPAE